MNRLYKQENNVWVLDTVADGKHIINYEVITQIVGTTLYIKRASDNHPLFADDIANLYDADGVSYTNETNLFAQVGDFFVKASSNGEAFIQLESKVDETIIELDALENRVNNLGVEANLEPLNIEVAQIRSDLKQNGMLLGYSTEIVPLSVGKSGKYVSWDSGVEVSGENFNISNPIYLNAGDVIVVTLQQYESQSAIVKSYENNFGICTKLVQGTGSVLTDVEYYYKADESGYVALCSYKYAFPSSCIVLRSSTNENLLSRANNIEESIGAGIVAVPTITYADGSIGENLSIVSSTTIKYSSPIFVKAGDTIELDGLTNLTGINCFDSFWVISECTSIGIPTKGLVPSIVAEKVVYDIENDGYIMFAVRTIWFVGCKIISSKISQKVGSLKTKVSSLAQITKGSIAANDMGYYSSYAQINGTAPMTFVSNTSWNSIKIGVKKGDVFHITGLGGGTPLLWVNCTSDNVVKAKSAQNLSATNMRIEIVVDGYLVCNFNNSTGYSLYKENSEVGLLLDIDYTSRLPRLYDNPIRKVQSFGLAGIIHNWGFIGDSLVSGFHDNINSSQYEYSWGQRMCAILGTNGYNFSVGGMTAKSWIYNNDSHTYDTERIWSGAKTHKKQGYIIGLGVNDRANLVTQASGYYQVGNTSTDIGVYDGVDDTDTNANTFVGYYAGIIQRIRYIQPNVPIFLITLPYTGTYMSDFNYAIRDIATKFVNVYVIDIAQYAPNFEEKQFKSMFIGTGHMNLIGYEWYAYMMIQYIDWIIRNNINRFKNVNLLIAE